MPATYGWPMATIDEKYLSFETFRRNGTGVSTPVWCVPLDDGRFGFWTSSARGRPSGWPTPSGCVPAV